MRHITLWGVGWRRRKRESGLAERDLDQLSALIGQLVTLRQYGLNITGHPTVYALRSLIADTVAQLPLVALRGTTRVDQPSILRSPDPMEPRRATLEKIVNSLTAHGNAYLYVYNYDADGFPLAVRVLQPQSVVPVIDPERPERIESWIVNGRPAPGRNVKHIPLQLDPGPLGTSPLSACADAFATATGMWTFASSYWEDGGIPPYALKHPRRLTAEQADEFVNAWIEARRTRRPGVLSDGIELEQYQLPTAADAMLLDGLNYLDAAIARAFLCPPSIVNVLSQSSLTYATTTDEMRRWLALALYPGYLARIEAAFSQFLPRGQVAVFDTSNVLRADYAKRVDTGAAAVAAGLITAEEWRAQEGLPPLPNNDPATFSPTVEGI